MVKIDAKQIVVFYMIDVDKFEMSVEAYKRFSAKIKEVLTQSANYDVEIKGLKDLVTNENSMFEKVEDFICLKKGFNRQDLYRELNLHYEVLSSISKCKNLSFQNEQECAIQL